MQYKNSRGLDSFKVLIDASKCTFDTRLQKRVYEVYFDFTHTGEIIKEHETKPLCISEVGIDTHYGSISLFGQKFIYILLNSKMLKERYFESINMDTIQILYNHIKAQKIVNITYDDFLSSKLTDVDVKTDFDMFDEPFIRQISERKKALVYPKLYSTRPNLGIEYVKRNTASPTNPYVKFYSKSHELFTRSKKFRDLYLPDFHNENLRRCEVTIRNHDHKKYIEKKLWALPQTLKEWCSLSQEQYREIVVHCVDQHEKHVSIPIDKKTYERNISSLTARDYMFYKMYKEFKTLGYEDKQIIGMYDRREGKTDNSHYSEKTRLNKLLRKMREVSLLTIKPENNFL